MRFENKGLLHSVIETVYGTDPGSGYTPIDYAEGAEIQARGEKIVRNVVRPTFSPKGHVIGSKEYTLAPQVELRGGGLDTGVIQLPEVDSLLQSCGLAKQESLVIAVDTISGTFAVGETINNTTSSNVVGTLADIDLGPGEAGVLYIRNAQNTPADNDALAGGTSAATANTNGTPEDALIYVPTSTRASMKSSTIHFYRDGVRHILTGSRGTMELDLTTGKRAMAKFNLTGLWNDPTDTSEPAVTFSSIDPPVCYGATLQLGTLDLDDAMINSIQFRLGNKVVPRGGLQAAEGRASVEISGREPGGSLDPEALALSAFNPWTAWKNATAQKITTLIGSTAGNRFRLGLPYALYDEVAYRGRDGILAYQLPFTAKGSDTGDDEFYLLFY